MKNNWPIYRAFFFHVDILVMLAIGFLISSFIVWQGIELSLLAFFVIGIVTFMFSEYLTHRFFFHLKAPKNPFFLKILKRLHYDHHKYPNDFHLLFLPIWYSLPTFTLLSFIFYLFSQLLVGTLSFSLGLILMLLVYEWKHYVAHQPLKPRTQFGKWLKKTHTLHHFKNENYWYGVSTPFVDILFGTLKDEKEVETSATAKELEKRGS
ncbi:fatty acid hydroxylase family protein [Anaerobacillus alkaliphilus]|uniref:Fatty acid hydroxylase family protein n=1 Tax=Anaerobacillus alkaliphilus TaxID=1548597 RepID=A0A4Q0VMK1_9BACI|nr:sterol desaturase family protein [Anaerobacillus alkaliphilus]RXI96627.1 fatty acid hydroxylase family protein [Anaerobacillus alkaliphilus]